MQKRFLLFLIGCIGIRFLIVLFAKYIGQNLIKYLPLLGYLALFPVIGFLYIFFTNSRQTGLEVFGGKIWWNSLRPIHAILYALFAYNAINKNANAWIYLMIDVIIGLISFLIYHYLNDDYKKL